jgi:thiamine-phosphate pyrophosphorylase
VLTDSVLQDRHSHAELARLALAGGADAIQFRQKQDSTRRMIADALAMKAVCAMAGAPLIINDRLDVALAVDADGVHLGQDDFPLAQARAILGPSKIIGGSAGNLAEALACREQGADYVGFGPVFATSSKDDAGPVSGLDLLRQVAQALSPLPVIAIGGIGPTNAAQVRAAGAHGLAVISAVCCQPDPMAAAQALSRAWKQPVE